MDVPCSGRFRYSDVGHLFHGSRGSHGFGYAVCLRGGRAASEVGHRYETDTPASVGPGYLRLRGGKDCDGTSECDGRDFAVQRGLSLGGSRYTDVFQLQIEHLADDVAALSIGIALRSAFCRLVGIQEDEVGVYRSAGAGAGRDAVPVYLPLRHGGGRERVRSSDARPRRDCAEGSGRGA